MEDKNKKVEKKEVVKETKSPDPQMAPSSSQFFPPNKRPRA